MRQIKRQKGLAEREVAAPYVDQCCDIKHDSAKQGMLLAPALLWQLSRALVLLANKAFSMLYMSILDVEDSALSFGRIRIRSGQAVSLPRKAPQR